LLNVTLFQDKSFGHLFYILP